jgi:hypothetical protein
MPVVLQGSDALLPQYHEVSSYALAQGDTTGFRPLVRDLEAAGLQLSTPIEF